MLPFVCRIRRSITINHSVRREMPPSPSRLIFLFLLVFFPPSEQQQPSLSPSDAAALLCIKSNLRDLPGSGFFSSWDFASSNPCLSFAGIICSPDKDGGQFLRVAALTLGTGLADSPGLTGMFPPSVANLTALRELIVYPGHISGPIPPEIGNRLHQLRLVSISGTLVSGPIPPSLAGLPELHTLDLGDNRLQGPIPPSLFSSNPSLKVLILASNGGLYGDIPMETSASQLLHLDLRQNSFTGSLPPLPYTLRFLSVSANAMTGSLVPAFAYRIPDLVFLDLSMNAFTGPIPAAIFSLPSLSTILLQSNNLSGPVTVPSPCGTDESAWTVVDLSRNMLTGQPPAGFAGAASLFLNDNQMTGPVPGEYVRSVWAGNMSTFYAQRNFLTAFAAPPLPLPDSVSLCLSFNCMTTPPSAANGCPASVDDHWSRPADECPNVTG